MNQVDLKRNPARTLREILALAVTVPDGTKPVRQIWCTVFDVQNPESEGALLEVQSRLISLRKLFMDTEAALRQIPEINEELYISPLSRLAKVVNINSLHKSWGTYLGCLTANDMLALEYSEDMLRSHSENQENEIPPEEIQQIIAELNNLYESIFASSLPITLKDALLDLIQEMLKGVHEYRVRGAVALKEALTRSIGIVVANKEAIDEHKDSEDVKALQRMLIRVDTAYGLAVRLQPLLQAAANIFPALAAHIK